MTTERGPPGVAAPSDGDIRRELARVIPGIDRSATSAKSIRKQLEKHFNANLKSRKEFIQRCLVELLRESEARPKHTKAPATTPKGAPRKRALLRIKLWHPVRLLEIEWGLESNQNPTYSTYL